MPIFTPFNLMPRTKRTGWTDVYWNQYSPFNYLDCTWEEGVYTTTNLEFLADRPSVEYIIGTAGQMIAEDVTGGEKSSVEASKIYVVTFPAINVAFANNSLGFTTTINYSEHWTALFTNAFPPVPRPRIRKTITLVNQASPAPTRVLDKVVTPYMLGTSASDTYISIRVQTEILIAGTYNLQGLYGITGQTWENRSAGDFVLDEFIALKDETASIDFLGQKLTFPVKSFSFEAYPGGLDLLNRINSSPGQAAVTTAIKNYLEEINHWPGKNVVYRERAPMTGFWTWTPRSAPTLPITTFNEYKNEEISKPLTPTGDGFAIPFIKTTKRRINYNGGVDYNNSPPIPQGPASKTLTEYGQLLDQIKVGSVGELTGTPDFTTE